MLENLPDVVTVTQLTKYLHASNQTILRALKAGKLQGFKVGRDWRIEKKAILEWINTTEKNKG